MSGSQKLATHSAELTETVRLNEALEFVRIELVSGPLMYLQKWNWVTVARSEGVTSEEQVAYVGTAGLLPLDRQLVQRQWQLFALAAAPVEQVK